MQPKHLPCHIRLKYEPTQMQPGKACRLHGKDFKSVADAARYFNVNYSWAAEQVRKSEEHSLNSSHITISYAVFCLKKKKKKQNKKKTKEKKKNNNNIYTIYK